MSTKASTYNPYKNRNLPVGQLHYPVRNKVDVYQKAMLEYGEPELIYSIPYILSEKERNGSRPKRTRPMNLLNLGDAQGGSAILLAEGLRDMRIDGHVWTVDCYSDRDLQNSRNNAKSRGVLELISHCQGKTDVVADTFRRGDWEFDFVFIDADHSFEGVTADWDNYHGLVAVGGLIAFHDTNQEGPDRVIRERVEPGWDLIEWVNRIKLYKRKTNG